MLTAALETSGQPGSVALGDGDGLVAETVLSVRATHSETVMPELARLLERAGRDRRELGAAVVGSGPGSFTGVRIACSLAKGLRFGGDFSLYAYSSLVAAAAGTGLAERVVACFDARRDEVYAAAWARVAPGAETLGPAALPLGELADRLPGGVGSWAWAGSGAERHREAIEAAGGRVLPAHAGRPRAAALLWLAREHPEEGRVAEPAAWEPEYVRDSSARRDGEEGTPEGTRAGVGEE